MKRTKINIPDAILTSDMHIRGDQPVCRTDDFQKTFWDKLEWLVNLAKKYNCPILHAGDLFHHWKPSPELITKAIQYLSQIEFRTIYGNHDLPQHSLELKEKCGVFTLATAQAIKVVPGGHWGKDPAAESISIKGRSILLWHIGAYQGALPYPGCSDSPAAKLLKKYPNFDMIVTGHNHKPFVVEKKGRLIVNPGGINRQTATEADYKPRVYFYFAATNEVVPKYIPIQDNSVQEVISREHIEEKEEREERLTAFISKLDTDIETSVSFEQNIDMFISKNKIKKEVKSIITNALDHE